MSRNTYPREYPLEGFYSGMENINDFNGFYIVTPGTYGSTHLIDSSDKFEGSACHHAYILTANDVDNDSTPEYLPHRAYPTVQLYKTTPIPSHCLITLYVKAQITLQERAGVDDWLSLITVSPSVTDDWERTVLVNLTTDGYLRLVHVPNQGEQTHIYQVNSTLDPSGDLLFPQNQWVRIDLYLNLSSSGRAIVWQNQEKVSEANMNGWSGFLNQFHAGLYASAAISSGSVKNDKLRIIQVKDESQAKSFVSIGY